MPGTCPWDTETVKSRTQEAAFALSDLGAWMQDVRAILDRNRACFPVLGLYLRFSKASNRWLGFNQGQDTVAFEIHVPKVVAETAFERSAAVYNEIMQMTLQKYNGRPHWGKNSVPEFEGVSPKQYPRWNDFMQLKSKLDPKGRFNNKFWRRMRGQEKARHYPGCALSRDCICKQDSDCGTGYQCVPGDHFTAARVCR